MAILSDILHAYFAFKSTPNYKVSFNSYPSLWQNYAVFNAITQRIFIFHSKLNDEWPPNP